MLEILVETRTFVFYSVGFRRFFGMVILSTYTSLRLFLDGMLCMMALYALLSFVQLRKPIYWQYALYIACMILDLQFSDNGYGQADYQPGAYYPETFVESLAYILYVRFAILFINPAQQDPLTYRLMKMLMVGFAIALAIDTTLWLANVSISVRSNVYMGSRLLICGVGLVLIPRIFQLRNPVVSYFVAGSLLLVIGSIAALLANYMPFARQMTSVDAMRYPVVALQIGVVGEVLCFTLGMSLRHRRNEQEKIQYQAQLIEQLRDNEQKQEKLKRIRDDIGGDLNSLNVLSQVATRQLKTRPDLATDTIQTIGQTARQVVATMREIVWSLNAAQTSLESFSYRLRETARILFEHQPTKLHLSLDIDDDWLLPAEGRRDLFLMTKEMMHNVIRHAEARNVYVSMHVEKQTLYLIVRDDGHGFSQLENNGQTGNGLRSMQQRANALNGELRITTEPGLGTTACFQCPLVVELPAQALLSNSVTEA
ncbi:sensor histidine kinase [Spirosoma pomorum]